MCAAIGGYAVSAVFNVTTSSVAASCSLVAEVRTSCGSWLLWAQGLVT